MAGLLALLALVGADLYDGRIDGEVWAYVTGFVAVVGVPIAYPRK